MSEIEANWNSLAQGVEVARYGVRVPWLSSKAELFELIPSSEFIFSPGGCWPMLRFKFLGFSALWGFNFVSHPSELLSELLFWNEAPRSLRRTYRRSAAQFHRALGRPNSVNLGRFGQQAWRTDQLLVDNALSRFRRLPNSDDMPMHALSVFRLRDAA
jgi:hypothetical protein